MRRDYNYRHRLKETRKLNESRNISLDQSQTQRNFNMSQSIIINKNVVSSQNDADLAYTVNSINGNSFARF
jgi:hypothetical protein